MKKFNKEEFDKVKSCIHCDQKFEEEEMEEKFL